MTDSYGGKRFADKGNRIFVIEILTLKPMGRWDITGIKNMKKSIFTLLLFFAFSLFSYAQDAKTSCKMPGTYDYVSADFYKGRSEGTGKIKLTNQATIPVLEIKVKVTCELDSHIDSQGNN